MWDYCFAKSEVYKGDPFPDIQRTQSLSAEADVEQIQMNLVFEKVAHGTKDGDQLH
jgi:hypothetical protein